MTPRTINRTRKGDVLAAEGARGLHSSQVASSRLHIFSSIQQSVCDGLCIVAVDGYTSDGMTTRYTEYIIVYVCAQRTIKLRYSRVENSSSLVSHHENGEASSTYLLHHPVKNDNGGL